MKLRPLTIAAAALLLAGAALAQSSSSQTKVYEGASPAGDCSKPSVPPGGFDLFHDYNNVLSYNDGYQSIGDLTWPRTPAPTCRWPLVVLVHGLPGSRLNQRQTADAIARRGYAVWAYEVRGQAQSVLLNAGNPKGFAWYGPHEKFDLAEQIAFARESFPGIVSPELVAVTGSSQGGIHAWFAAAYSGKTVTAPGRGIIEFPEVACTTSLNFNSEPHEHFVREGTLFDKAFIDAMVLPDEDYLVKDPAFVAKARQAFLLQNPQHLLGQWSNELDRLWGHKLGLSSVPTLWVHSYLDEVGAPQQGLAMMQLSLGSTPRRVVLSTNGHGTAGSDYEKSFSDDLRLRWLDRFLWSQQNGIEHEAQMVGGVLPLDPAERNDMSFVWARRFEPAVEHDSSKVHRLMLYGPGHMGTHLPLDLGSPATIAHTVPEGYTAATWAQEAPLTKEQVLALIPLSEVSYETVPVPAQMEISGRPAVDLSVTTDMRRFQLTVLLEVQAPGLPWVNVATWGRGFLDAPVDEPMRVKIELPYVETVLPAGSVVRLTVRNLWMSNAPKQKQIEVVPYFVSSVVSILHGPGSQLSYLDLPVRKQVGLALKTPTTLVDFLQPSATGFEVVGGKGRAGHMYRILVGSSGQLPGQTVGNATLPVNYDPITALVLTQTVIGDPAVAGFQGLLDAEGNASATLDWSALPPLLDAAQGQRLTFVAWTSDGLKVHVSNPTELTVE